MRRLREPHPWPGRFRPTASKKEFSSKGNKKGRQTWFALAEDAPKQVFYRYPRAYRIKNIDENVVEMKEFNISENINDKADFDTELKKRIVTNEKRILKIARQDYYLLQIVKFLFEELGIKFRCYYQESLRLVCPIRLPLCHN